MDENKKAEGIIEKKADGDTETGDKFSTSSLVEQADAAAERLARENDRKEALLRREEELMARKALGGISEGPAQPEPPKEETPKEFKDKFMKGELPFPK